MVMVTVLVPVPAASEAGEKFTVASVGRPLAERSTVAGKTVEPIGLRISE